MIDSLHLRIPRSAKLRKETECRLGDLSDAGVNVWRSSPYYAGVANLSVLGIPALVHDTCMMDRTGDSKLELLDAGRRGIRELAHTVETVYDLDARRCDVMRIDLAADVPDARPRWFFEHMRLQKTRWCADIGRAADDQQLTCMGKVKLQTIYYGRRPNVLRVYDKVDCWQQEYAKLGRWAEKGQLQTRAPDIARLSKREVSTLYGPMIGGDRVERHELPPFEKLFGWNPERKLVRVERQIGRNIPMQLSQFSVLKNHLPEFNPFARVVIEGGHVEPDLETLGPAEYLKALGYLYLVRRDGLDRTRKAINRAGRHAARLLDDLSQYLGDSGPRDADEISEPPNLYELYRTSVERQLAA